MEPFAPEMYTDGEMEAVESHIMRHFGEFSNVLHEIASPDIHVDICLIPPNEERDFYTLVTMGMGAHRMNVPDELAEYRLERAELAIFLPTDWDINSSEEKFYWPIRTLKQLARMPIYEDTWLGWGHTIDNGEKFAENTELSSVMLLSCPYGQEAAKCRLPNGEIVNFYQLIPLHRNEMNYKIENGADALLDKFTELDPVVDISRDSVLDVPVTIMDNINRHGNKIAKKKLAVNDLLAGADHMAAYLRWCIENDLMSDDFKKSFGDVIEMTQNDGAAAPLREFIQAALNSCLFRELFNDEGQEFAAFYYDFGNDEYCYPCDVDRFAEEYFGTERYNSEEFKDEAYLFIPYDENYYQGIKKYIDFHYAVFKSNY
ncbi:MAG: suppressor of fused domain protein [Ruminococcus sp.]|nr:suppressor of fused domain protein [Ruminococcus sp.]